MTNLPSADIGLGQTLLRRATISPDKPALTFEGKTQSFADLGDRVRRLAAVPVSYTHLTLPTIRLV